jgi:hypothetical protein
MTSKQEQWQPELGSPAKHDSDLRKWAEHLSDRTVGIIVLGLAVVLLIGLLALFSALFNSFLAGTAVLTALAGGAAALVTRTSR